MAFESPDPTADEGQLLVAITPLGIAYLRPIALAEGFSAPVHPDLSDADAPHLLATLGDWHVDDVADEPGALDPRRGERAAADGRRHARRSRRRGDAAARQHGPDAAARPRRAGSPTPAGGCARRVYGRMWLLERGLDRGEGLDLTEAPQPVVDSLAATLDAMGPDAMTGLLLDGAASDADAAATVVSELWRAQHPRIDDVLDALASGGPAKVAKAARKAQFRRRS